MKNLPSDSCPRQRLLLQIFRFLCLGMAVALQREVASPSRSYLIPQAAAGRCRRSLTRTQERPNAQVIQGLPSARYAFLAITFLSSGSALIFSTLALDVQNRRPKRPCTAQLIGSLVPATLFCVFLEILFHFPIEPEFWLHRFAMSALCCCVSRRKHTQDARSHHPHNIVDGHQERPQQIPRALPQKLDSNAVIETDKEARIKEIPFGAPAHLDELVVDDDDDSDTGGDEPQPHLTRQASAALGAVRARFTRHRSSESDVKRQSTASVGKSQEEIARRAELRRLRHKRIQDELKHELEGQLSTDQTSNASIKSARPGSLTSPSQSQPGGGPRDTIEFAVLDGNQVSPKSPSLAPSLGSRKSTPNKPQLSQKVSSIDPKSDQDGDIMHQDKPPVPDTQAEPRDPKPDFQLLPHSETRSTFRLSNSPSWLDRIIGVDNTFSETGEHPSLDGRSALSIWLAAQGLRSRDSSMANLDRDTKTEAGQEHGSEEAKLPDEISISVSDISHRSGSSHTGLQPSREVAPVRGSSLTSAHWRPHNHLAEPTSTTDEGLQRVTKSPSEDLALDYAAALAFTSPNDHTSSQYASRAQSFQPSPSRSKPNLHHLDTLDLQVMRLSPFECE